MIRLPENLGVKVIKNNISNIIDSINQNLYSLLGNTFGIVVYLFLISGFIISIGDGTELEDFMRFLSTITGGGK